VVTGANSGIGWHTALELARAGAEVILAARTEAKGRDAVERIRREISQAKVRAEVLDLASLRSVRAFTAKVSYEAKLDLLVNNAGVMSVPKRQLTEDGFELQFGTNFLGPFALTGLLMRCCSVQRRRESIQCRAERPIWGRGRSTSTICSGSRRTGRGRPTASRSWPT